MQLKSILLWWDGGKGCTNAWKKKLKISKALERVGLNNSQGKFGVPKLLLLISGKIDKRYKAISSKESRPFSNKKVVLFVQLRLILWMKPAGVDCVSRDHKMFQFLNFFYKKNIDGVLLFLL